MSTELVVVEVHEQRTATLAGHEGAEYTSPPQERRQGFSCSSWCSARRSR
jgi:hypothetical protein